MNDRIPPHLALLLDFLVSDHVERTEAQAQEVRRTYGVDHPTASRARQAALDALELRDAVRLVIGRP